MPKHPSLTPEREATGYLSTGRALAQFAAVGAVVLVLLATISVIALNHVAVREAVEQARELTETRTQFVVAPAVTDGLSTGNHDAVAAFDHLVRTELLRGRVVRVKLWAADGSVLYSDQSGQIGEHFALDANEQQVLRFGGSDARLAELDAAEEPDQSQGRFLEVYARVKTPSGQPMLFETYLKMDSVLAYGSSWMWALVPAVLLALLTLQLCQLPLAWRLIRRVQQGQRDKEVLQRRALEASNHRRRRIAADLHDGLVQHLVGVSLSLSTAAGPLRSNGQTEAADQLEEAADATRAGVTDLRSLITEIYPPSLEQLGLRASIVELLANAEKHGLRTTLVMPADPQVPSEITAALHRATQESLRNVLRHASATEVRVELTSASHVVGVVVTDDGVGLRAAPTVAEHDHFGLRLLSDLAIEIGGRLEVTGRPGGGTRFRFELPTP